MTKLIIAGSHIQRFHSGLKDRQRSEAALRGVLSKKVFLEISQNLQENTCAWVSFLITLQVRPSVSQVQEKLKVYKISKLDVSSSCFIVNDSHVKIVWLHVAVFSKHNILHFWNTFDFFKYYPLKVPQNCFNSFSYSN